MNHGAFKELRPVAQRQWPEMRLQGTSGLFKESISYPDTSGKVHKVLKSRTGITQTIFWNHLFVGEYKSFWLITDFWVILAKWVAPWREAGTLSPLTQASLPKVMCFTKNNPSPNCGTGIKVSTLAQQSYNLLFELKSFCPTLGTLTVTPGVNVPTIRSTQNVSRWWVL